MRVIYERKEIKWGIVSLKRINVRFILFLIISNILFISFGKTQDLPNEMWHPGYIVLESEDTLKGRIQYDFESNIIQYREDKRIQTFTSQNVLFFSFHCQYFKRLRSVYSIPYQLKGRMNTPVFFEILEEGKLTLMAREYVTVENNNRFTSRYRMPTDFGAREILTYNYFLLTDDGEIHKYSERKRDLYPYFGKLQEEMKKYIKSNKLKSNRQGDLVRIITHYNLSVLEK